MGGIPVWMREAFFTTEETRIHRGHREGEPRLAPTGLGLGGGIRRRRGGAGELGAVPGEGGGDDGVVVVAGGRTVAIAAVGQALEGIVGEFAQEDGIVEQGDIVTFNGEGEGFDERSFGFGAGVEAADGQALADEGVDIGFADAVGFGPNDSHAPLLGEGGEAISLELPTDLIKAFEGDHFPICRVNDCDGGVIFTASPIDAGDVGMSRLGLIVGGGGGGLCDAAEDRALVVAEKGFVFGLPDDFGCAALDAREFGRIDEAGLGGAEMEGSPFFFFGIEAGAMAMPEPVSSVGRAEEAGGAAGKGEHGTDDVVPDTGGHPGGFVDDGKVQAFAAKFIGVVGAADGDDSAFWQVNAAIGRAYVDAGEMFYVV